MVVGAEGSEVDGEEETVAILRVRGEEPALSPAQGAPRAGRRGGADPGRG